MSRAVEANLLSLLPTQSENLPKPLVDLASSLFAQSKHNSTLKQDEEIARSYACCHIACERLKISLNLPDIQPRPPIAPKVYKRVYAYLDNVLPATPSGRSGRIRTPSAKIKDSGVFGSSPRTPSRPTPTAAQSLAQFRSPATAKKGDDTPTTPAGPGRRPGRPRGSASSFPAKRKAGGQDSVLPAWVRPSIQLMCKTLGSERIGKTVLAGLQSIAAPRGRASTDPWITQNLAPLLAAVYFLVTLQVQHLERGTPPDDKEYRETRKIILGALSKAPEEVTVKGMDEDELWIGWTDVGSRDIDAAVAKVVESGWQDGEWFTGINQLVAGKTDSAAAAASHHVVPGADEDDGDVDMHDLPQDEGKLAEALHVQKSDTMLQSKWVMTDKKRKDYERWRDEMLQRIEAAEHAGAVQAMEA
ncbi:origin recognition complex subunit 6-domain-containing protein [Microdochium trichocladiopsis]|uniref:Origin recognition complex subunit 6-domain-containing protein n=1 Tax=Microdochium trichocladiopsis TaxID=1682393 RepID=A0A9P8YDS3_9PEZI|nr:origin recognition complex subunit 6-domain-containing protein [Microdochium trichocladiopsis]KAH7039947.1 origin recognition complex subunit 6-domain-containing protein [Microdochium trichocladiopsis]